MNSLWWVGRIGRGLACHVNPRGFLRGTPPRKKLAVWRLEISKETQGYSFLSGVASAISKQALDCTHSLESNRK